MCLGVKGKINILVISPMLLSNKEEKCSKSSVTQMRQDKKLGTSVKSMVHKQSWHLEQEK